ncbi:hypothetical protein Asp14428_48590 [Actinoplanes sp. NBRC 14428]|uniref:hypothetical protein n=1 Tax=Pseudosporangium ferrugineum TaxID=439699 RepID=UPI0011B22E40|nr:hypothetical protein [Pseudosporangium ferrugineum]BCJ53384.1 hypothetical protein Asp14428_48590 [Actinoplanes sp. NBRC 14428]
MSAAAKLITQDHLFALVDGPEFPLESANWSTGLCAQMDVGALIYTGANKGRVTVEAAYAEIAPDIWSPNAWQDAQQWDDIAEVSVHAPHGNLEIHQLAYGPFDTPPRLPCMSADGSGTYRLRVYARGRDRHYDEIVDNTGEEYRIATWPAAAAPPLIIRSTSRCGYSMRVGG